MAFVSASSIERVEAAKPIKLSLSVMVSVTTEFVLSVASPVAALRPTVNVSSFSTERSFVIFTVKDLFVSPGAKLSVPVVAE